MSFSVSSSTRDSFSLPSQPLIMDYIAAQHPATAGGTLHGGAGGKAPAPAAAAVMPQTGGEPRIRTVKMRGAGGFHLPSTCARPLSTQHRQCTAQT